MSRSSAGGVSGASVVGDGGSADMMAEMSEAWLRPWNARLPVAIS